MAFCTQCGTKNDDSAKFCTSCGKQLEGVNGENNSHSTNDFSQKLNSLNNTADTTYEYSSSDIENTKVLAIFSYIGFFFIIPLIAAPNSKFARFHANQGILLFITEILYGIASGIISLMFKALGLGFLSAILNLFGLVFFALMIIGILNVINGKAKELPVIGSYKILNY